MRIVTRPAPCAMVARFMARRSALVGRSRIHSANARMMMEATITPMEITSEFLRTFGFVLR